MLKTGSSQTIGTGSTDFGTSFGYGGGESMCDRGSKAGHFPPVWRSSNGHGDPGDRNAAFCIALFREQGVASDDI